MKTHRQACRRLLLQRLRGNEVKKARLDAWDKKRGGTRDGRTRGRPADLFAFAIEQVKAAADHLPAKPWEV